MRPQRGTAFRPDARLQGEYIDLAHQRAKRNTTRPRKTKGHRLRDFKQLMVRNDHTSETLIPQYGIIELSTEVITPSAHSVLVLGGASPADTNRLIAIAQTPIKHGVAGKCTVSGVSVCMVNFPEGNKVYNWAKKIPDDITKLEATDETHNVEILSPKTQTSPGNYWVLVRLLPGNINIPLFDDVIVGSLDCCQVPCADPAELTVAPSWDSGTNWPEAYRFRFESSSDPYWDFANGEWTVVWDAPSQTYRTATFTGPCGLEGTSSVNSWRWTLYPRSAPVKDPRKMVLILAPNTDDCAEGSFARLTMTNRYEFVPACANYMYLDNLANTSYYDVEASMACSLCLIPTTAELANYSAPCNACSGDTVEVPTYIKIAETLTDVAALAGCCAFHTMFIGNKITCTKNPSPGAGCVWNTSNGMEPTPSAEKFPSNLGCPGLFTRMVPNNPCRDDFYPPAVGSYGILGNIRLRCKNDGNYRLSVSLHIQIRRTTPTFCDIPKQRWGMYRTVVTPAQVAGLITGSTIVVPKTAGSAEDYCDFPESITLSGF